jgi:hypothetical protein
VELETTKDLCELIIDCSFIVRAPPPKLPFEEMKQYYSPKHGQYGMKFLCCTTFGGLCCYVSRLYPGAVHDIEIAKSEDALLIIKSKLYNENGKVLADKGFTGLQEYIPFVVPPKTNNKSYDENVEVEIARRRVLIENYFCRMKTQFPILSNLCKIPYDHIEKLVVVLVFLTNFHIWKKPLRKNSSEQVVEDIVFQ